MCIFVVVVVVVVVVVDPCRNVEIDKSLSSMALFSALAECLLEWIQCTKINC